jgi:hypothetical protein
MEIRDLRDELKYLKANINAPYLRSLWPGKILTNRIYKIEKNLSLTKDALMDLEEAGDQ